MKFAHLTKGGKPIENADNRNIGLGHNTDVGAHTSIEKFGTENRAEQDIGEFLSKKENRPMESLEANSTPAPRSRERAKAPVASNDRWLDEGGRVVGDVIRTGRKAADDARRQAARLSDDISRGGGGLRDHIGGAVANPGRAAMAARDRISAGAAHAGNIVASGGQSASRAVSSGWKTSGTIISSGAKSAGGAISAGAKNAGGFVSSGTKSAGGYVSSAAKSVGGVFAVGAKNAGGFVSSG